MDISREEELRFYKFICEKFGTEDIVKYRRISYAVKDLLELEDGNVPISSGSKGEGLHFKSSDFDEMNLCTYVHIYEEITVPPYRLPINSFAMETCDTQPGFTRLRWISEDICGTVFNWCEAVGQNVYLSNLKVKLLRNTFPHFKVIIHGPCTTTVTESYDMANCFRCKTWPKVAQQWIYRARVEWPHPDLISKIVSYGTLFVPIGQKNSPYEHIEWRLSFSVSEKLLIFSFCHVQLMCYALLKIMLKELIEKSDDILDNMLCSYFLKAVMFWVSEEEPISFWQPSNLTICFRRCVQRLLYFVSYSFLPHYFIPQFNMLEARMNNAAQSLLIDNLKRIYSEGLTCFRKSNTLRHFWSSTLEVNNNLDKTVIGRWIETAVEINDSTRIFWSNKSKLSLIVYNLIHKVRSKCVRWTFMLHLPYVFQFVGETCMSTNNMATNKQTYTQEIKRGLPMLLLGLKCDAVSGWIKLGSYFYCRHQIVKSLQVSDYVLTKFTPEKAFGIRHSDLPYTCHKWIEERILIDNRLNINNIYSQIITDDVLFNARPKSDIFPFNCRQDWNFFYMSNSPIVFAHFLRFLCLHQLKDYDNCRISWRILTNVYKDSRNYCIVSLNKLVIAFTYSGIASLMLNEIEEAKQCFLMCVLLSKQCDIINAESMLQSLSVDISCAVLTGETYSIEPP